MSLLAPKMDIFLSHIKDFTGISVPLEKVCKTFACCLVA